MAFADRLLGYGYPKIAIHKFQAVAAEYVRGKMTGAQATAALEISGNEVTQANALLAAILNGNASLVSTTAWQRAREVEEVLELGEARVAPYDSVALVMARLGF